MEAATVFGKLPLKGLLFLPLAMLALCVAAGAELEAALAAWLAALEPASRGMLLAPVMLGALGLPPLCAAILLLQGRRRRRAFPTEEGKS